MAGLGPARVGAARPRSKIRRVAGGKIILPLLRPGGAELPQVGAERRDVVGLVVGGGLRAEGGGRGVQLKRRAGAAVAGIVPQQRDDAAAAAHIQRALPPAGQGKAAQQQRIGRAGNYVVEGRDIGTAVFPEAELKVFLTASAAERAHRRVAQNERRGVGSTDYAEVLADIERRDAIDSSRDTSPLKPATDAVQMDSTGRTIEQVIERICALAQEKGVHV